MLSPRRLCLLLATVVPTGRSSQAEPTAMVIKRAVPAAFATRYYGLRVQRKDLGGSIELDLGGAARSDEWCMGGAVHDDRRHRRSRIRRSGIAFLSPVTG